MKDRIILDLCGGTGAWSKPYKEAGYDVRLLTLPDYDVCEVATEVLPSAYGILAAPPCTEFSLAKGNSPRDFDDAMRVVRACMEIIWTARILGNLKWWAMENPVGFLRQFLGIPAFTFEQWQFSEIQVKRTDVWGYFKPPKPNVKIKPKESLSVKFPGGSANGPGWAKPQCPPEYKNANLTRAAIRAITPPGFAQAFFKANS